MEIAEINSTIKIELPTLNFCNLLLFSSTPMQHSQHSNIIAIRANNKGYLFNSY